MVILVDEVMNEHCCGFDGRLRDAGTYNKEESVAAPTIFCGPDDFIYRILQCEVM